MVHISFPLASFEFQGTAKTILGYLNIKVPVDAEETKSKGMNKQMPYYQKVL